VGIGEVTRAVFLDRDGVLNDAVMRDGRPHPPAGLPELRVAEDAPAALARLKSAGFLLIVVTNQPDISRGTQTREAVDAINSALAVKLPVDEWVVCPHDSGEGCECRKPRPGMVLEAAARHEIDLSQSYMIGDRWRDVDCGHSAGVATIWIDRNYRERGPDHPADFRCGTLAEAVDWILARPSGQ
jgi:D-glycero-D-manno-heptose 1,7-bisphosphate phosphatase